MPASMIERVAREIARTSALDDGKDRGTADDFTDAVWEDFVPAACSILRVMRDPSAVMLDAEGETRNGDRGRVNSYLHEFDAASVWRAMIDAALESAGERH